MRNERIVSTESKKMVCHKPGCRYIDRINGANLMHLTKYEAESTGYHICRYCNSMNHHVNGEKDAVEFYEKHKKMQFNYIDGILYVKTDIGCWKLVYVRKEQKLAIYHRNNSRYELDFTKPQYEKYHRQDDKEYSKTLEGCLKYIYEHDKYKAAIMRGETVTKFSSKKYAKREANAERKRQRNRVDYLFRLIEREDAGMKKASVC